MLMLIFSASGCYVTRQAWHHQQLYFSKKPVADVLSAPETSPKTRTALESSQKVLQFAADQGLQTAGAYKTFIATPKPVVSYIVQAAYKDRLELRTWWFPVVGSVPYLGFYEAAERDEKAQQLRNEGYDVTTGGVGAFSSLGWFDDPLFSSMLSRSHADLANLLFHELIHRTLWIPGSTEFNENLAEYGAGVLTDQYFDRNKDDPSLAQFQKKLRDKEIFRTWLWELHSTLKRLYETKPKPETTVLLESKANIFQTFTSPPKRPKFEAVDYIGHEEWNNATVLSETLYAPDTKKFAQAHACFGRGKSFGSFLEAVRAAHEESKGKNAFEALAFLCSNLTRHRSSLNPSL
jgi:predicted aminopeptidase